MSRAIPRALAAALVGALAGGVSLALGFTWHPAISLEMDRDVPQILSGVSPVERHREETFAWTSPRADVSLAGLDRRVPWVCSLRFRGGRPPGIAQPSVDVAVDGVALASTTATNSYQDLNVPVATRPREPGVRLTVTSSTTFVPGPSDPRELGVQVDRIVCRPAEGAALPPRGAVAAAAMAGAALGAAFGFVGVTAWNAFTATVVVAAAQAVPLATGPALYTGYHRTVPWIALWTVIPMVLGVAILERWRQQPLHGAARFVIAYSAGALYLMLLALLHPSKAVVDAVFHAHRLEWVLAGRYYFTQPMPDGVQFPYAIALYLFAAPWSAFTRDHVALLRIVVCASHVAAGALLYPMIVRTWGDRLAGALAVVLFNVVPLAYMVLGNANLTNAFGHSAALVTMAAATLWPLASRDVGQLAALFLLASVAFLSHVSTFPLLLVSLLALAAFYRWLGGPVLRVPARSVFLATTAAAVFAIVAYYGQFGEVYTSLDRVRGKPVAAVAPTAAPQAGGAAAAAGEVAERRGSVPPLYARAATTMALGVRAVGWPIVALAVLGAWRVAMGGVRHRLGFALLAWGVAYVVFVIVGVMAPVDVGYYRYAIEFIDRVTYATFPAAVVLAARGAAWAWRAGTRPRIAAVALVLYALVSGVQQWMGWLRD